MAVGVLYVRAEKLRQSGASSGVDKVDYLMLQVVCIREFVIGDSLPNSQLLS